MILSFDSYNSENIDLSTAPKVYQKKPIKSKIFQQVN